MSGSEKGEIQKVNDVPEVIPDPSLLDEVEDASGQRISSCYQCNKCSSGCPVSFAMDFLPNKIIRMIQMGLKEEVLRSSTIWLCASCETCATRCPNEVDIVRVMDSLRQMSILEEVTPGEKNAPAFHSTFLSAIKSKGRVHELGMIGRYRLKSGGLFKDMGLGWGMLRRGKFKLLPDKVEDKERIKGIFQSIESRMEKNS